MYKVTLYVIYLFIHSFIHSFIHLLICLFIYLFIYLFIWLIDWFILQNELNGRKRYSEESKGYETSVTSYLLRFSDRIDGMKKLIRKFLHPIAIANRLSHTWKKPFHPIRTQLSEWISQFANTLTLFLAPLQSSFTEVCRVSTSLLKFYRKFAINYRQSSNRFIALDKPIKKYIQELQGKKTRTKTRWDAKLACLANFLTEGRGKKSFKEGKYAMSLFRRPRVLKARRCRKARSKRRKRARQGERIKRSWSGWTLRKIFTPGFEEATCLHTDGIKT